MQPILVVDDDTELCKLLTTYLGRSGFKVTAVHEGERGLKEARDGDFALIVLDVMLPGLSGFDVLRKLRQESSIPILMLTARDEDIDRIVGLELGADDYLPKPFNPRELVARIKAILRRTCATEEKAAAIAPEYLEVGEVTMDLAARTVQRSGEFVELTTTEFALLEVLLRSAGRVVKREELSAKALGRNLTRFDRSIDVHVSKLRKKLALGSGAGSRIRTVRSIGYQYTVTKPVGSK